MTNKNGPRKGTCPVCGRVFEKTPGNRVYCSEECSVVGHRRKAAEAYRKQRHAERGLKPITHICTVCGWDAAYHIHVAGQLTCSIQCIDELYAGVLDKKKRREHTRGD